MEEFVIEDWLQETETVESTVLPQREQVPTLTTNEVKILNYVEQVYWETGLLPTAEAVSEELTVGVHSCRKAFQNEVFQTQLASRGIDPTSLITPGKLIKETRALSAKQVIAANMMLNLHDKRSQREKLAQIQVSSQQFHAWMRQPSFVEFMRKRSEALFGANDWQAYRALIGNVAAGDNKSLELFFRMRNIYNPTVNVNVNIESVLMQVVEVIARHVKDPTIINAIAGELDSIIDVAEEAS